VVFGGATVSSATLASGATLTLGDGALLSSTDGGATFDVMSGGASVGTITNNGATIDVTGASAKLEFVGNNTFDSAAINLGSSSGDIISSNDPGTGAVLTFGPNAIINHITGSGELTGDTNTGDGIVNQGVINAVATGGTLTIDPLDFTNSGTITVRNGDTVKLQPVGSFTNLTFGDLTGGTYDIGAGSVIELSQFAFVTTLDATLILGGSGASLQTSDGANEFGINQTLTTIGPGGALYVEGDASPFFQNALTDAGILQLGGVETQTEGISIVGTRSVTLDGQLMAINGTISDEVGNGSGAGVGSLIVDGGGSVLLAGSNTYTGGTMVTGSSTTLQISEDDNLGSGGTLGLGAGAVLELLSFTSGTYSITHAITVAGDPIFLVDTGANVTFTGVISDGSSAGTVELNSVVFGGTLVLDAANTYTGGTIIDAGTLEIAVAGAAGTGGITFAPAADPTLQIDGAAFPANTTFTNTIFGFAQGDDIDLRGLGFHSSYHADLGAGNVLVVTAGSSTYDFNLDQSQDFTGDFFHLAPDNYGATLVFEDQTPCFCRGTLIRCKSGEVPVETLKVGDKVRTLSGKLKPITWIGHGRRLITAATQNARPLVVCRGALAKDVPKRDLRLTRGHSLYLDGMLVPVEYLVNGRSIYWDERMREVEFYHIELAQHDVLIADGAPAESYREDGNRGLFDNPDPPRFTTAETPWFAPVVTGGPELDALWRRLLERSGFSPPALIDDPDLHLLLDGRRLDAIAYEPAIHPFQGIYRFRIEEMPARDLRIASRHIVPALTGTSRDPRRLGVAIRSVLLRDGDGAIELAFGSRWFVEGFHSPELAEGFRWTDGYAQVPQRCLALFDGPFEIMIDVGCTTRYPLAAAASASQGDAKLPAAA
jgi:autotransporter-associated beta strand protein